MLIKDHLARLLSSLGTTKLAPESEASTPQNRHHTPEAAQRSTMGRFLAWPPVRPLAAALLLTLSFVTFPPAPKEIGTDGDVSWSAVLSYAHEHRLQFGTDIVFTYGPLGFLIQPYFSTQTSGLRMAVDLTVCFTAAAGLCLVAWRLRVWERLVLLGLFVFAAANLEGRTDLVLDVALLCWGLLCFVESGRTLDVCVGTLAALCAFAALAKLSFLFVGAYCIVLVTADLFIRGQRLLASGMVAGFGFAVVSGWIAAGQNLSNFDDFLVRAVTVVSGYNQALGWEGLRVFSRIGFVLVLMCFALIALRATSAFETNLRGCRWRRALLFIWAALLTFSVWKHSFLREDFRHPAFLMGFAPVLALGLGILPSVSVLARRGSQALAILCCLLSVISLQWLFLPSPRHSLREPFRAWFSHLQALANPAAHRHEMLQATEQCRREAELPVLRELVGDAAIDCFGFRQVYLLFNGMNYQPRPVFQSYAACTEPLMRWNEEFYLSKTTAPDFVLFSLNPVDRKFPALEDARVLRALLFNYRFVAAEQDFLLLRAESTDRPGIAFLEEGSVRPGEAIDLRNYRGNDLWLEILMEPSWTGRIRQIVYRSPTVRLAAYGEPGKSLLLRRRAPAAMLAAGFVASPLLTSTEDVRNFYAGSSITRPGAYAVELASGTEYFSQEKIRFRIYRIER